MCTNDDYDDDIVDNDNEGVIINIILYIQIENVEQELLTSAWDYCIQKPITIKKSKCAPQFFFASSQIGFTVIWKKKCKILSNITEKYN